MPTVPADFIHRLEELFGVLFTRHTWRRVPLLVVGTLLATGRRTVTAALRVLGLAESRSFQAFHRVLHRAVWSPRAAGHRVRLALVEAFVPTGPVLLGLDDTIERPWGKRINARGIHRDPVRSSRGHFVKTSGLHWLSVMLLAPIPWAGRVWALPFLTAPCPSERYDTGRQRPLKP